MWILNSYSERIADEHLEDHRKLERERIGVLAVHIPGMFDQSRSLRGDVGDVQAKFHGRQHEGCGEHAQNDTDLRLSSKST